MILGEKIRSILERVFFPNRSTKKFMNEYLMRLKFINITNNGFTIRNNNNNIEKDIKWNTVNDIEYDKDKIVLKLNGEEEKITVPMLFHENWHKLIKEIPEEYPTCNYDSIKAFFDKLQGCEICGLIAVEEDGECIVCGNTVWNEEYKNDFESKEAYLKQMQIYEFEPNDEDEQIEINNNTAFGFESFSKWNPLIKEEDFKS